MDFRQRTISRLLQTELLDGECGCEEEFMSDPTMGDTVATANQFISWTDAEFTEGNNFDQDNYQDQSNTL